MLSTSQSLMTHSAALITHRLDSYLRPLDEELIKIGKHLSKNVIDPNDQTQFRHYLYELINDNPNIYGAYWGKTDGSFYGIDKETESLTLQHIVRSPQTISNFRYVLDNDGQIVKTTALSKTDYDPRLRQWYQQAVLAKKPIWTEVYSFYIFGGNEKLMPGITAAIPIYNNQQQLLGVFGIDLTIDRFINFIQQLQVTPNASIYIIDQNNQVVAYSDHLKNQSLIGKELTPDIIHALHIPLPSNYESSNEILRYRSGGKDYFATLQTLDHKIGKSWRVAIIIPVADILGPLKETSLNSLLLTIISLLIGVILIHYISQKISKPIMLLADRAKALTEFAPTQPIVLHSIIKEINYMNRALVAMHKSLASFQRYVPKSLVKKLVSSGIVAEVGGENKELTFLFSDIKNFTHIAETTEPQKLMQFLSRYFEEVTHAIIETGGTLDKYIGDGVMAFWNAPTTDASHALHACQSAKRILQRMDELNQYWQQQGFPTLRLRIGIHTGYATVGNVGSEERLSYTAIGDSVNLSSRLEALNKIYGTRILVSQVTYEQVSDQFAFRLVDEVAVRGKQQSIIIYELITDPHVPVVAALYQQRFDSAFALYQQGQWQESLEQFAHLVKDYPDDSVTQVFVERCKVLMETKPSRWDGVWRMEI